MADCDNKISQFYTIDFNPAMQLTS